MPELQFVKAQIFPRFFSIFFAFFLILGLKFISIFIINSSTILFGNHRKINQMETFSYVEFCYVNKQLKKIKT